jgi:formylglycine-generating enzyme required for sulfatase activity
VFSSNANNSAEIKKELALASQHGLTVIPVRVEDVAPNDAFAYEFATRQWIDLFHDFGKAVERLAGQIGGASAPAGAPAPGDAVATVPITVPPLPPSATRLRLWHIVAALCLVLAAGAAGVTYYLLRDRGPRPLSVARERALKPKDSFRECPNCPEMVVVPAGSFTMGSTADPQASPPHHVVIARPFAVGRFALTFDEWDQCVAEAGCRYKAYDREWGRGRLPVINVSWNDAKTYLAWLSRKTAKPYRLLTEAEREYVARAGTTTPFWWGATISTGQANYDGNYVYGDGVKGEWRRRTVPVDSFEPNPGGLYQVHGNVWEWVEDCWNESYAGAPADGSAWAAGDCTRRAMRGGSWFNKPVDAAAREQNDAAFRYHSYGFRVARALTP